ncbi:hypothetical protein D3P09_02615 [Paenibacillus pinisoli]|uniref:CopG family transcriptional regulator n=1 Tax=Paenibacillus pinisoli TaxID=1276110 RepID=A0A3A6PNG8_9BACL|nr:hypothetical protein [Paenibacillus pinisoli]RJX40928.1 hypothetical protein D3P09_02615 [Paenibacillus pinisoli]
MSNRKMGRPTTSPKNTTVRARMDKETIRLLDECVEMDDPESNRSIVMRKAIEVLHEKLKQKQSENH